MTKIEVLRGDEVTPSVTWQAVSFMRCTWPSLFDGGLRWIDRPFEPDMDPVHVVARHGEVLLSHAVVVPLEIEQGGRRYDGAALACVFTFPPYRGQGLAGRVLETVSEVAQNAMTQDGGADVAGLFCHPSLEGFYARYGWTTCPGGTVVGDDAHVSTDLRMMRFLSAHGRAGRTNLTAEPLAVPWEW